MRNPLSCGTPSRSRNCPNSGLRVSESCSVLIKNISFNSMSYYILKVMRKVGRYGFMSIPFPFFRLIEKIKGSREDGPPILISPTNHETRSSEHQC